MEPVKAIGQDEYGQRINQWLCEVCGWWNQKSVEMCASCQNQKET